MACVNEKSHTHVFHNWIGYLAFTPQLQSITALWLVLIPVPLRVGG